MEVLGQAVRWNDHGAFERPSLMRLTEVPVSPAVLQWARKFRRLSEDDAADKLDITPEYLRALENGDARPSLTLFENIAAKYKLPQSTLFRGTPPKNPPEPIDYRTLRGDRPRKSFELSVAISNARTLINQLQRIAEDDSEYRSPKLPNYEILEDAGELGERERQRLDISFERQKTWGNAADAFRQWRRIVEAQGISVFMQKFPLSDCRGFTIFDAERPPCIIVNKDEEFDVARIFTLAHEYCHLLIRKPGLSDENSANPVEAFCNRFAAGFLMPRSALRQLLPVWPNEPIDWSAGEIENWARQLKVSRQALAIRLEELKIAPEGFNRKFATVVPLPKRKKPSKVSAVTTRISEIGLNYASVVLSALDRRAITLADAVEAFGLAPKHFYRVRDAVTPGRMPEFKYDYLLDADVLGHIQLRPDSNEIYAAIVDGIAQGRVKTVRQIASGELRKFSEAYAALHPHRAQFEIDGARQFCVEVQDLLDRIPELVPGLYEQFGGKNPDPADPWLIAVAKVHGFTLVTDENRNSPKRIPMACDLGQLKCRCISGPHFLFETGIVEELRPEHIDVHSFYDI